MGNVEERKELAANAESEAKRLYLDTGRAYYAVLGIAAARSGGFRVPRWAMEVLFTAIQSAVSRHHVFGEEISLDQALGLKTGRGKSKPSKEVEKEALERWVFSDIRILCACFKISIPAACELVYNEPDFSFARLADEGLTRPISVSTSEEVGMSKAQIVNRNKEVAARNEWFIERFGNDEVVKNKLRRGEYWTISTGDRLGYSLESLIDKYYRFKKRDHLPNSGGLPDARFDYHRGRLLQCSRTVRFSDILNVPVDIKRNPLELYSLRFEIEPPPLTLG